MDYNTLLKDATRSDDYVNATLLCKEFGKTWQDFSRKAQTKRLIVKVQEKGKTPVSKNKMKGKGTGWETYVCPELAIALAEWLSPEFHLHVLEVFKAYVTADANLAKSIIKRNTNKKEVESIAKEASEQAKYLDSYHGVHDRLKEKGCTSIHHAAYNKNVNRLVDVEDGRRADMDRVQRLAMHLVQAAGELALLYDDEDVQQWKAVKKATKAGHQALTSVLTK